MTEGMSWYHLCMLKSKSVDFNLIHLYVTRLRTIGLTEITIKFNFILISQKIEGITVVI
jgi:hypothetical protein